jgi:hypothetical protein
MKAKSCGIGQNGIILPLKTNTPKENQYRDKNQNYRVYECNLSPTDNDVISERV